MSNKCLENSEICELDSSSFIDNLNNISYYIGKISLERNCNDSVATYRPLGFEYKGNEIHKIIYNNNIGNGLDYNSNRALFFPKYVDKDTTINTLPYFPPVGKKDFKNLTVPYFKEVKEYLPLNTPVNNWHSVSPMHQAGLGNSFK